MLPTKNTYLPTLGRRQFCTLLVASLATSQIAWADSNSSRVVCYVSVGNEFRLYQINGDGLSLTLDSVVTLPATIQYAWPHPSLRLMYVAYSNRSGTFPGDVHGVAVLRVDERSGRLSSFGAPLRLRNRPISITVEKRSGKYLLVAYNDPSQLDVFPIDSSGTPGLAIDQKATLDVGIFAHQVRVTPDGRTVMLVSRGNDAVGSKHEDPGAINVFRLNDGHLSEQQSVSPGGGYGFGPRHIDFHPSGPWLYVSMERQNQLQVFGLKDGQLTATPLFVKTTLENPAIVRPGQVVGPIHVSRDGRYVYLANRSDGTIDFQGRKVYGGGENSLAVFQINQQTGEPKLIQNIPTQSYHCRTFTIHPDGKSLITASIAPMLVRDGEKIEKVSAALTEFRIGENGMLTFVRKYDIETPSGPMFWTGFVALDSRWSTNDA